ncbi:hypothetical protein LINGRAPRIM_LOCUS1924 [Linum grandiflorum]
MIESGFVFTQISTANLDLHTKRLGSARNPPKRLGFGSCFSGDSFRLVFFRVVRSCFCCFCVIRSCCCCYDEFRLSIRIINVYEF